MIDFYEYYEGLQEGWDGPALLVFSDGNKIGARLDRNGLRPARFWETDDGIVYVASEVGVLGDVLSNAKHTVRKGRLGPGQMVCADLADVGPLSLSMFAGVVRSLRAVVTRHVDSGALTMEPLGFSPMPYFHGEQLLSEMADILSLLHFFVSVWKQCLFGNGFSREKASAHKRQATCHWQPDFAMCLSAMHAGLGCASDSIMAACCMLARHTLLMLQDYLIGFCKAWAEPLLQPFQYNQPACLCKYPNRVIINQACIRPAF